MFDRINHRRFFIGLILGLAFGLRLYHLDTQSLRGDEAATVHYSALPISQLWELSRVTDPHPPLYYLMLHGWQWLMGESAWMMRFAGVLASTLAVAALCGLAQTTLRHASLSLIAAALLALSPLQVWLAQDIRSYPFITLLGLLSSVALWWALEREQRRSPSTRSGFGTGEQGSRGELGDERQQVKTHDHALRTTHYALRTTHHILRFLPHLLITLACFYIHYYTVFLIAFQGLFVLLNLRRYWDMKWTWLVLQGVLGVLMIPGLMLAYNFIGQAAGGIEKIATLDILRLASTALLTGFTLDDTTGLWISLILAPVWLIGLASLLRQDRLSGSFWGLFFAIPALCVIGLSIDRPFFKERFLVQAQPAFVLLLAAGFLNLWPLGSPNWPPKKGGVRQRSPFGYHVSGLAGVLLLGVLLYANGLALKNYFTDPAYVKAPPWRLYHDYVEGKYQPGDVMLTNFPEASISYYSPNGLPFYVVPAERDRQVAERLTQVADIAGAYRRIWFLPMLQQGFDEQGEVLNWLDRHADRVDQVFFPNYNLNLYLSPPATQALMINYPATFAEGLQLRGYQVLDRQGESRLHSVDNPEPVFLLTLEPKESLTLSLYWQAGSPTVVPYTVFVHLIAADGFNRVGQDNQPVWGSYPTTRWLPGEQITDKYKLTLPAGTPPGDHRLRIGWYQAETQERLPVLDEAGQVIGDHLVLNAVIRVE